MREGALEKRRSQRVTAHASVLDSTKTLLLRFAGIRPGAQKLKCSGTLLVLFEKDISYLKMKVNIKK